MDPLLLIVLIGAAAIAGPLAIHSWFIRRR